MQRHVQVISATAPGVVCADVPGRSLKRAAHCALVAGAVFVLAGCSKNTGSFDVDESGQTKWDNLMALVQFKPLPNQPKPTDLIICPEIEILDGTASQRFYAPGGDQTNETVRYQFSIGDYARECVIRDGQYAMKIGVVGKVLLGPAGAPGAFTAPIRVAIIRQADGTPAVSKLYQVPTNVPPGQTEAPFTLVTEPLSVPLTSDHAEQDYAIKIGFNSGGNGTKKPVDEKPANGQAPVATASGDQPAHHHHHRRMDSSGTD